MKQFTKDEAGLIYNWMLNARMFIKKSDVVKCELSESIRVKALQIMHNVDLVDETKLEYHFTPAAAFEAMGAAKLKSLIKSLRYENERLKSELVGLKETDRVVILRGAEIQKECEHQKQKDNNISEGFKAILDQLAEAKKELKYSNQTRDALNKSNEEAVSILDDLISVFSNQRQLPQIQKAVDFINNKLF